MDEEGAQGELLWKDPDYNDHPNVHPEWARVAEQYNQDVGFEVCRVVSLRDYDADGRVGVGVYCIVCKGNTHYSAQTGVNGEKLFCGALYKEQLRHAGLQPVQCDRGIFCRGCQHALGDRLPGNGDGVA